MLVSGQTEVSDPLGAFTQLPLHHVLYPHGFPVHVKSNDPAVIRAAELSWGGHQHRLSEAPIELRFVVSDSSTRRKPPSPVFRAQANLLAIIADRQNFACCDLSAGFGFACLSKGAVLHSDYLRYQFLEAMAYTLLDTQHVVALHAACLQFEGHGVLFVGESGAGKSSLAYACAMRGWTYVSDDASSLIRRKKSRTVVGNPRTFRFRPTASSLFPELHAPVKVRNGKPTIEIRTETLRHVQVAHQATIDHVIFLNRLTLERSQARLARVPWEDSFRRLCPSPFPPELSIHEERMAAMECLLAAQAYELTYKEFDPAIELLEHTLRTGNL